MARFKLSTLSVIILVGVVLGSVGYMLGALVVSGTAGSRAAQSQTGGPGSVYATPVPVTDFTLTDQTGAPFTFSSTRGKVVLMSFLFTHCGDVCPFSAIKMRQVLEILGERAKDVELVVVTTDPERDTVELVAEYSRELGLYDLWHYVTGTPGQLQKVYKDLKITVIKAEPEEVEETAQSAAELGIELPSKDQTNSPVLGLTESQIQAGSAVARKYSGGYNVAHSAPFWVVDPAGLVRASLDVSATPVQLAEAVSAYLP